MDRSLMGVGQVLGLMVLGLSPGIAAASHPCAQDARNHAHRLLALHGDVPAPDQISIDAEPRLLAPRPALAGEGVFDVLEITGHIYRASYRMRFLYAQFPDSCVLMGQEILEIADPY